MAPALAQPLDLTPASSATAVAAMLESARAHQRAGRDRQALEALEAVLRARPHLGAVQLELAQLRLRLGEPEAVVDQLGTFLNLQAGDLATDQRQGLEEVLLQALLTLERWEEAERLLQHRLAGGRPRPGDHGALARAAAARGDLEAAATQLLEALRLEPERAALHRELGRLQRRRGRWPEALAAYARAQNLTPRDGELEQEAAELRREACWAEGENALAEERWAEARAAYGQLLALDPQHPLAAQRLELLQQLAPQRLRLASDGLGAPQPPGRQEAFARLERFSRLLDQLETAPGSPSG